MRAYLICRNFSVNDGMYPAGHAANGTTQGLPVAIGRERGRTTYSGGGGDDWSGRSAGATVDWDERVFVDGSLSGGSSPGSDRSHYGSGASIYSSVTSRTISSSGSGGSTISSSSGRRRTTHRR
ncbi:MAG: hypothetical protein GOMPHAMPRED_002291 [Gomphillus americanus]|uniref:Uncharacterized protein n=1 Tax=Gomphillus americanus TaxID=1940652 RepID=A0A8H3FEP1_9LECA|nr:MAG: hypothetical protein GOMPHAMPRED_002291 [Gomphillus americanus]